MDLREILALAVEMRASDVHVKSGLPPAFRVNGRVDFRGKPLSSEQVSRFISQVVTSEVKKAELTKKGEVDVSYSSGGSRFRVNVFREQGKYCMVFRRLPEEVPELGQLGLPQELRGLALIPRGMVVVTGITGSGKSTTLAAMLEVRNREREEVVITIENPVEYVFKPKKCLFYQREVGRDTQSFFSGLVAALREDPDVILVGEIRDSEQMNTALSAVETGHAVFTTVHAVDAVSTFSRILSFYPAADRERVAYSLSVSLKAVVSQRLVPSVEGSRIAVVELLEVDGEVSKAVSSLDFDRLKNILRERGKDFDSVAFRLYEEGKIDRETLLRVSSNPKEVERWLM